MGCKKNDLRKSPNAWRIFAWTIIFSVLLVFAGIGLGTNALADTKITKSIEGFKFTLTVSPKMLDLLMVDAVTGKAITDARVKATIVHPDEHKITKNLMGMKMGEVYSYMNSFDTSPKGLYTFHIVIEAGNKTLYFNTSDVK